MTDVNKTPPDERSTQETVGWQPIETAPKAAPILVRTAEAITVAVWHEDQYGPRFSGWTRPDWPIDDAHPAIGWKPLAILRPSHPPEEDWITRFDTRLRSKLTPALNSGTAMEMLILVGETLRELQAERPSHPVPQSGQEKK